jgi:hypothetical protein
MEGGAAQAVDIIGEKNGNRRLCRCCNMRQDSIRKTDFCARKCEQRLAR